MQNNMGTGEPFPAPSEVVQPITPQAILGPRGWPLLLLTNLKRSPWIRTENRASLLKHLFSFCHAFFLVLSSQHDLTRFPAVLFRLARRRLLPAKDLFRPVRRATKLGVPSRSRLVQTHKRRLHSLEQRHPYPIDSLRAHPRQRNERVPEPRRRVLNSGTGYQRRQPARTTGILEPGS